MARSNAPGPYDGQSTDEDGLGENYSVANGIERASPDSSGPSRSPSKQLVSRTQRGEGILEAKNGFADELANKQLPSEETDLWVQRLERQTDEQFCITYRRVLPLDEVLDWALVLKVGLMFLPGADKLQVTRLEQIGMAGREPDQKNADWRVNTARSLLVHFHVETNLGITQTDQTSSIVRHAKDRRREDWHLHRRHKSRAMTRSGADNVVMIDSSQVRLVSDLRTGIWDLEAMLIEVAENSLKDLVINFRHLIAKGGPQMSFDETRMVLETMIEDARRLCIRSPILFRMSTRARIIKSKNTRYGVNHGHMFFTLTVSSRQGSNGNR